MTNDELQKEIVAMTKDLGKTLGDIMPKNWGFVLMIFPFGEKKEFLHYVSNANRDDVVTTMMEFVQRSQEKGFYGQHTDRSN